MIPPTIRFLTGRRPLQEGFSRGRSADSQRGRSVGAVRRFEITDDNRSELGTLLSWSLDIQTLGLGAMTVFTAPTGDPGEIATQQFVTIPPISLKFEFP